jgi:hypothetical protein
MKKIELIRAIFELNELKIISSAFAFKYVKEVMEKTVTGTNKNFDKFTGEFLDETRT